MQDAFSCSPKARTDARIIANNERPLVPVSSANARLLERSDLVFLAAEEAADLIEEAVRAGEI